MNFKKVFFFPKDSLDISGLRELPAKKLAHLTALPESALKGTEMSAPYGKPVNCTCDYPEVVIKNMNGHSESCPVYIAWHKEVFPQPVKCNVATHCSCGVDSLNMENHSLGCEVREILETERRKLKPLGQVIDNSFKEVGQSMRRFYLNRMEDQTGVSRTGRVLEGVLTQSGKVFVEWRPPHSTMGIYNSFEEFKIIHVDCHPSCNEVVWIDQEVGI